MSSNTAPDLQELQQLQDQTMFNNQFHTKTLP